ncbi:hypothetical protein GY45DRAFT_1029123 [Cubamyces sp. BRFM 1775]|nr:hypothetical protein GY45DRAFT_1029123 [Cubamyces sp. BRFM 1775]
MSIRTVVGRREDLLVSSFPLALSPIPPIIRFVVPSSLFLLPCHLFSLLGCVLSIASPCFLHHFPSCGSGVFFCLRPLPLRPGPVPRIHLSTTAPVVAVATNPFLVPRLSTLHSYTRFGLFTMDGEGQGNRGRRRGDARPLLLLLDSHLSHIPLTIPFFPLPFWLHFCSGQTTTIHTLIIITTVLICLSTHLPTYHRT